MRDLLNDFRLAARGLGRSPGFTAVAVLTLALGIGAVSAIFSFVRAIVLAPLPYPDADRLVMVWQDHQERGGPLREWFSWPDYLAYHEHGGSLADLAVLTGWGPTLTGRGEAQRLAGAQVTASMFATLGVRPALGRGFVPAEEVPGGERVVVIGHGLWQRLFDGSETALGATLTLGGEPYEVVGVMPAGFRMPLLSDAEVWAPLRPDPELAGRGNVWLRAVGRLAPGATLETAREDLGRLAATLADEYPESNRGVTAAVFPLHSELVGDTEAPLAVLLGAALLVLLVACANLANLQLARSTGRSGELAVRAALGAGRGRLARHLLAESLVLAALGGALGLLLAAEGVDLLKLVLSGGMNVPRLDEVALDPRVVVFTSLLALASGLLFGTAPALSGSRPDLERVLRRESGERSGGGSGGRLRDALVVAETALALTLLTGAALLLQSFVRLQAVDPGFDPHGLVTFSLFAPPSDYPEAGDVSALYDRLLERLGALPGVESAAATAVLPLAGRDTDISFVIEGEPPPPPDRTQTVWYRSVTPGYFATVGMPILAGGEPVPPSQPGGPAGAVVNQAFVDRYLPGRNPVGRRILAGGIATDLVGVTRDVKNFGLTAPERPAMYLPHQEFASRGMAVVLRASVPAASLSGAVRAAVADLDPSLAVADFGSMELTLSESLTTERVTALLAAIFGAIALALAAVGLYGVMSYSARRRSREVGIRMALGAAPAAIEGMFLRHGLTLAALGVVLGLAGSLAVGRILSGVLFEVRPTDPGAFAAAAVLLTAATLLAAYLPARRATRADPLASLHE